MARKYLIILMMLIGAHSAHAIVYKYGGQDHPQCSAGMFVTQEALDDVGEAGTVDCQWPYQCGERRYFYYMRDNGVDGICGEKCPSEAPYSIWAQVGKQSPYKRYCTTVGCQVIGGDASMMVKYCVKSCPEGTYYSAYAKAEVSCLSSYDAPDVSYTLSGKTYCSISCPANMYQKGQVCVPLSECTELKYEQNGQSKCVSRCPSEYYQFGKTCVLSCGEPNVSYKSNGKRICASSCPIKYYMRGVTCVSSCDAPDVSYTLGGKTYCASSCPDGLYQQGHKCVSSCDASDVSYTSDGKKFCATTCPDDKYKYKDACYTECPSNTRHEGRECVVPAPITSFRELS